MLLMGRSCLAKPELFLFACIFASTFAYDVEYEASREEHSDSGPSRPDYSSYYKNEGSSPLVTAGDGGAAGFSGAEFGSFFSSPDFGFGESASTTKEVHKPIPLIQPGKPEATGFVPALNNFQSGFNSNSDPFSRDYFEQSAVKQQQQQQRENGEDESETRPGPSYISYRVPAPSEKVQKYASSEVQDLNGENDNDYDKFKKESTENYDYKENLEEDDDDKEELNDYKESSEEKPEKYKDYNYKFEPEKVVEETKQAPYKPQYYTKYTEAANPALSPYQKFSFQPTADAFGAKLELLSNFESTAAPFNPTYGKLAAASAINNKYENQPTQNSAKATASKQGKKCKKINKEVTEKDIRNGRFKRQAMNCYVCEDPKNGANYEQCSYSTEPNTESYFVGKSERYTNPNPTNRYKRDTRRSRREDEEEETSKEEYVNPYDAVKKKSHKYYSQPTEFSDSYYKPKEYNPPEYRFPKEYFQEEEQGEEKSESEIQSEKLVKDGENCKKVKRKSMTCMVCTNPKTGGNYEQCSYSSQPAEKKYAYSRERKYDENQNPIEDKVVESSEPKEVVQERKPASNKKRTNKNRKSEKYSDDDDETPKRKNRRPKSQNKSKRYRQEEREEPEESQQKEIEDYKVPSHFAESTNRREKSGLTGLDPELFGSADSRERKSSKEDQTPFQKEIDDYHYKHYNRKQDEDEESETKQNERKVRPEYEYEDNTKKDVEAVLAEFAKKDRSKCKKAYRDGMTCYLCVDKNGMKNEECMFVSESQPKSSHIAYHEVKRAKDPEDNENIKEENEDEESEAESKKTISRTSEPTRQRQDKNLKKRKPQQFNDNHEESSRTSTTRVRTTTVVPPSSTTTGRSRVPRRLRRDKNIPKEVIIQDEEVSSSKVKRQAPNIKKQKKVNKQEAESEPLVQEIEQVALETSPVYSKVHGVTLPKYMVDVSDYEKTFDSDNHANH